MEYQKGHDNIVADVLSQVVTQLDPDTLKLILDRVTIGAVCRVETHDPVTVVESDYHCRTRSTCCHRLNMLIQMHAMDWAEAQREDPSAECSIGLAGGPKKEQI